MTRQLKLGAFLMATGHHVAAWRHPQVPADAGLDFAHYKRLAQIAEAAKFDALFLADSIDAPTGDIASRMARSDHFEPLTLLSALSVVTEHIGLITTATTSYNEPYHVARKFASLDHLSGGRGVESGDVRQCRRSAKFWSRRASGSRRALQSGAGISSSGHRALGQLSLIHI